MMRIFATLLLIFAWILTGTGMDYPVAAQKQNVTLPMQKSTISKMRIKFPAIKPRKGFYPVMRFNARIVTPSYGGWNYYLSLTLNGVSLENRTQNGNARLLRRGECMKNTVHGIQSWWRSNGKQQELLLFFAPRGTEINQQAVLSPRNEGFTYYLNITDCVNFLQTGADSRIEENSPNILDLKYSLTSKKMGGKSSPLEITGLEVIYLSEAQLKSMGGISIRKYTPGVAAAIIKSGDFSLQVNKTGGMELDVKGERYYFESLYSYPAQPKMKFNTFGVNTISGIPGWTVSVKKLAGDEIEINGKSANYKIKRNLKLTGKKIKVTDKLWNIGRGDIGFKYMNTVGCNKVVRDYRLAGQTGALMEVNLSAANPTVFLPGKNSSVGMVAEDSVSRVQLTLHARTNVLSMGSETLGLPAKQNITQEWSIYPGHNPSYYAFINQVRRDWRMNYTIPGPAIFIPERNYDCKLQVATLDPWLEFSSAADVPVVSGEKYLKIVKPRIAEMRSRYPGIKLFGKIETNLVPFNCDEVPWGNQILQRTGSRNEPGIQYGQYLSAELTRKLDAVTPYKDSILRNTEGLAQYDNFYPLKPYIDLMVQPEVGNFRYKHFIEQIDFLMDTAGFDGIYVDQFRPGRREKFSRNRWDGVTVELDDYGKIKQKLYDYALTGIQARVNIVQKVIDRGGMVIANGQPITREEQSQGVICFQEQENNPLHIMNFIDQKPPEFSWETACHLGTPIILGVRPIIYKDVSRRGEILNKGIITGLRNGVLFYYYWLRGVPLSGANGGSLEVGDNMFPFTPVEINEGFLIGKERTITAISGQYKIGGKNKPKVMHFNKRGIAYTKVDFPITGKPDNWEVTVKLDDWNEIAIIVKQ